MAAMPVLDRPLRHVAFRFDGRRVPNARLVSLVGAFNRWDSAAEPLRRGSDGWWTTDVLLAPGEYEYMFLVDGVAWNDPLDDGRSANVWGGHYSVRVVV
ncbi:MAG TPA: hypothetical protein VJT33_12250 [bacterium]|nr:hypothetical protein [bacterium]